MRDFRKSMALFGNGKDILRKVLQTTADRASAPSSNRLREVGGFGSNPGNLRMFQFVPHGIADNAALVVVLHGCTQTAASYDHGAGWSTLADRYGFVLLFPEQQQSNNPSGCFNWFLPDDVRRGSGEALSIREMVDRIAHDHAIDRRRIFITGLSAGGAMTSAMLACYPEVFAAGAIIAGLPFGAASNVQEAFESMRQCPTKPAHAWGELVRRAAPRPAQWPRISVWHGNADTIVVPSNAREILKQWTDVHGLPIAPSGQDSVDGHPRQVWIDDDGEGVIESYSIARMTHGTPLATGDDHDECGAAGPFLLDVGISSSYHIAKFFGLTAGDRDFASTATVGRPQSSPSTSLIKSPAGPGATHAAFPNLSIESDQVPPRAAGFDVGAVIAKALRAAGLLKEG